jgi:hypothetical protein
MTKLIKFGLILGLVAGCTTAALADEVNCEAGQKKTAFSDGNSVSEVCVDASQMDQTVSNPEVLVGEDPTNTDGHSES